MSIFSLPAYIDVLKTFLKLLNINFDIIYISETRLNAKTSLTTNINIPGYYTEQTFTELRSNLNIYNPNEPESTFVEFLFQTSRI